jgi:hypothetical protein
MFLRPAAIVDPYRRNPMRISRLLGWIFLMAVALSPAGARALTIQVRDVDLLVSGAPGNRRADYPSHRVFVGDYAAVNALVFHDGTLRNPLTTFTTTAPVTGLTEHARQSGGLFTGPFTHPLPAGYATFTAAGHYRVAIHVSHEGGSETADASFDIEVVSNEVRAVNDLRPACLAPQVHFVNPGSDGWICLNQRTPLTVSPTLRGCDPYTLTVSKQNADGTWTSLGTHSGPPWSITATFNTPGAVHLKAELRDRNGGTGEVVVNATVGMCIDARRFQVLEKQIRQLPPPDKCPACGKLADRFEAIRKQLGGQQGQLKLHPAVLKELESLESDVKTTGKNK